MTKEEAKKLFESFGGYASLCVSVPNLMYIDELIRSIKPKKILEVGAGRGTITKLLLDKTDACVDAFENEPALIIELEALSKSYPGRVRILRYDKIPKGEKYDLVILDGPGHPTTPDTKLWGKNKHELGVNFTKSLVQALGETVYFLEGHRYSQRLAIVDGADVLAVTMKSKLGFMVDGLYQKGGLIIKTTYLKNPTFRSLNHFYARIRMHLSQYLQRQQKRFLKKFKLVAPHQKHFRESN